MATYVPAKRGVAFRTWVSLVAQAARPGFKSSATLAAGDVKVSKDGGALANLTTLPVVTPAASVLVQVDLSAAEMTADIVTVVFQDAAGAEWDDLLLVIPTAARQIDDLAFPATSGRSMVVDAAGLVDANAVKVGPTGAGTAQTAGDIPARIPAALVGGRIDASVGAMAAAVITAAAHAAGAIDANAIATDAIGALEFSQAAADKIWASAARSLTDKAGFALAAGEYTALVNLVWDELTSEARTAGSYGQKLKDLALTGTGRVDVGLWLGSAPNALVAGDVPANVRAFLAGAIVAAAFAADAVDATALAATATAKIADRALGRSIAGGADGGRTVTSALRRVRNRLKIATGTLTAYQEDDTTPDHTAVVTTAAGDPITEIDPV